MTWKDTLQEILAERRQRYDDRPSLDQLVDLRDGSLSSEDRERLLEQASVDPEVARELFDVLRFPEVAEASEGDREAEVVDNLDLGDDLDLDDDPDTVDQRWQSLRQRLHKETLLVETTALPSPPRARWGSLAAAFVAGIAAALIFGALGFWPRPDPEPSPPVETPGVAMAESRVNLPLVELLPRKIDDSIPRGTPDAVVLGPEADGLVLVLAIPDLVDDPEGHPWKLLVFRETGKPNDFTRIGSLEPGDGGVFVVYTPRELWADGLHILRLSDTDGRQGENFALWVELR